MKNYKITKANLLEPAGLTDSHLQQLLSRAMSPKIDYADLYFQSAYVESWVLEHGIIKDASYDIEHGVGIRSVSGERTGFAYSSDLTLSTLMKTAEAAKTIANCTEDQSVRLASPQSELTLYGSGNPLESYTDDEKVALLKHAEQVARKADSRVSQVIVGLSGVYEMVLIAASDGTLAADVRPLVRLNVQVLVEDKTQREHGYHGGGGRGIYTDLLSKDIAANYAEEAVREAVLNLSAKPVPAGTMPVVLGSGWAGILLHEAIGHGLEGDFCRKGSSAFSHRLGEKVASSLCTIVDDGSLPGQRGSLNMDDEGTPTQSTVLIEKGILKGYMQDKLNARLMKMKPTGNARRESYAYLPIPRMTNTYMFPGESNPQEIIESVDDGIYAVNFSGGQVDITSGKFVFTMSEAYKIEKGKVTYPIKDATLIGSGPEVLNHVSMVGNDLAMDGGIGVCGKEGQSVPVGVGQPTLKIDEMVVGGTE